jgi:hypothetical protein
MTTASSTFDGIRIRAAQIGLYETPILHGRLANVTALTAALGSVICDRHAQPRALQCRWLVSATDMLDWVAAVGAFRHRAKEAKQASHFDGRYPASFEWTVKIWENVPPPPPAEHEPRATQLTIRGGNHCRLLGP